jgi:hypothetical protein
MFMPQFDFYTWSALSFWTIFFFHILYLFLLYFVISSISEVQNKQKKLSKVIIKPNIFIIQRSFSTTTKTSRVNVLKNLSQKFLEKTNEAEISNQSKIGTSFNFKIKSISEFNLNFGSKEVLNCYYRSINSTFNLNVLNNDFNDNVTSNVYKLYSSRIKYYFILNKLFKEPISDLALQTKMEGLNALSVGKVSSGAIPVKGRKRFKKYHRFISEFFSEKALTSIDTFTEILGTETVFSNYGSKIASSKVKKINRTTGFVECFHVLHRVNLILCKAKLNNWGEVIIHLITEIYQNVYFEDKTLDVVPDTIELFISELELNTRPQVVKFEFCAALIKGLQLWYNSSFSSIVLALYEEIRDLYSKKKVIKKISPGIQDIEEFLIYFDEFRYQNRVASGYEERCKNLDEKVRASEFRQVIPCNYLHVVFDDSKVYPNTNIKKLVSCLKEESRALFLIPEILANISYLIDLDALNPINVETDSRISYINSFVSFDKSIELKKILLLIIDKTEIFTQNQPFLRDECKKYTILVMKKEVWDLLILDSTLIHKNLPMVCFPKHWKSNVSNTQLLEGGYLCSPKRGDTGIRSRSSTTKNFQPLLIKELNTLQRQPCVIDGTMLSFILSNYDKCLKNYLLGNKFLANFEGLIDELFLTEGLNYKKTISEYIRNRSQHYNTSFKLTKEIKKIFFGIHQGLLAFFSLINIAVEYYLLDRPFYMVFYLDARYRCYSLVQFLSVHGTTAAKSLINFAPKKDDLDPVKLQYLPIVIQLKKSIMSKCKGKDYFPHMKLVLNKEILTHVSIDVTASGPQIYSGITGDALGLTLTNFIHKVDSQPTRLDLYQYIFDKCFNTAPKVEFIELLSSLRPNSVSPSDHYKYIIEFINTFDRKLAKSWTMKFFYSQSTHGRLFELYEICQDKGLFFYLSKFVLKRAFVYFEQLFVKTLKTLFPYNIDLLSFYKKVVGLQKGTFYGQIEGQKGYVLESDSKLGSPLIQHYFHSKKEINLFSSSRQRMSINVVDVKKKYNYKQAKIAIAANAIQNQDAGLCFNVLLQCFVSNIPVMPSHDAFFCRVQDIEAIQNAYFIAFCALILEQDNICSFLSSNATKTTEESLRFMENLDEILTISQYRSIKKEFFLKGVELPPREDLNFMVSSKKRRKKILNDLNNGKYIKSYFILS